MFLFTLFMMVLSFVELMRDNKGGQLLIESSTFELMIPNNCALCFFYSIRKLSFFGGF